MTSDKAYAVEDRINTRWAGDNWTAISLSASWTGGPIHVRLTEDQRSVMICATTISGGTVTDGTQIASFPAKYTPAGDHVWPVTASVINPAATELPRFELNPSGGLIVRGINPSAAVSFEVVVPLDI